MNKQPTLSPKLSPKQRVTGLLPHWLRGYDASELPADVVAGLVVGILVIPQSLGYAVLAGLPPVYGLYASIFPVLIYAWVGSSNVQAIGAVAITAIMTLSVLDGIASIGSVEYAVLASLLSLMVGTMLWLAGYLKLGWITQFISRGVSAGFVSGAAVLIFMSQIKYVTGMPITGTTLPRYLSSIYEQWQNTHLLTLWLGLAAFALFIANRYAAKWLWQSWLSEQKALWAARLFPLLVVGVAIAASQLGHWSNHGIRIMGNIDSGLPRFVVPMSESLVQGLSLLPSAGLMALIAFVSSSSVASTYARMRGERFDADIELKGLGLANVVGGFTQSFPVAGGFSRTAINVDSGAQTPLASIITVAVMVAALLLLSSAIAPLPYAILGSMIMASIISLVDVETFKMAWRIDRSEALSFGGAFMGVLLFGLNIGLVIGIIISFAGLIWESSKPHVAVIGRVLGTEHFRNLTRHDVLTYEKLLILRVDESLFFGNSESIHKHILKLLDAYPKATDLILMMTAVNHVDLSGQEMLIQLNRELIAQGKRLHYSVVKGPTMDLIKKTPIITELSGNVFLSTAQAVNFLTDDSLDNDNLPDSPQIVNPPSNPLIR